MIMRRDSTTLFSAKQAQCPTPRRPLTPHVESRKIAAAPYQNIALRPFKAHNREPLLRAFHWWGAHVKEAVAWLSHSATAAPCGTREDCASRAPSPRSNHSLLLALDLLERLHELLPRSLLGDLGQPLRACLVERACELGRQSLEQDGSHLHLLLLRRKLCD